MGYRLINIDKVLLLDFIEHTNSKLIYFRLNNDIINIKLKYLNRIFDLNIQYYQKVNLKGITMDQAFNYIISKLKNSQNKSDYNINNETLTNIINLYNKSLRENPS